MSETTVSGRLRSEALTGPVRRAEVREFFRGFAARHPSVRNRLGPARRAAAIVGVIAGAIGLLAMAVGVSEEFEEANADLAGQLVGMAGVISLMIAALVLSARYFVRSRRRRGTPARHYRLARFASDNEWSYEPGPYRGTHLSPWQDRGSIVVSRLMRSLRGRTRIEFANYELETGPTGSRRTQMGGYCALRLPTRLPHIVLESTSRVQSRLTALAVPERAQRLSLEGDFDRFFTLYCPEGYERDALYLFTPDVMARLIDRVRDFDVEIIDDWLFLVRSRDVVTLDPQTWLGIMDATDALADKVARWERWRDDGRATSGEPVGGPAEVRLAGRRLRVRPGRGAIVGGIGIGAFVVVLVLVSVFGQR